ncbi:hypothetical protein [Paraburkholderia domus]|uniref:hypothetical protein n=1 Tax=Paraburkholderia domus TaxID=2793075 RepID=UPI001B8D833D|nr:hypothetical protein [Paraburkholderia domus]
MDTAANADFLARLERSIVEAEFSITRQAAYASRFRPVDSRSAAAAAHNQRVLECMQRSLNSLYRARTRALKTIS